MKFEVWLLVLANVSALGFFLDWLFQAKVRKKERARIRRFFHEIYAKAEGKDIRQFQVLVANDATRLIASRLGSPDGTLSLLKLSLYSFTATVLLSMYGVAVANVRFNTLDEVPLLVFKFQDQLHPQESTIFFAAALLGNLVFDFLTIVITLKCLNYIIERDKGFFLMAAADALFSYLSMFCVLLLGSLSSKLFFVPNDLELPRSLFTLWFVVPALEHYVGTVMLFASASTFLPVLLYTSALIALSLLRLFQWVFATISSRFSEDGQDKTFFGWIATALSLLVGVFKLLEQALKAN